MRNSVLVVDDDPLILETIRAFLEEQGYKVLLASDGLGATKIQRQQPADLIITDIVMPHMDGLEVIQYLRRDFPNAKIIAIANSDQERQGDYLSLAAALGAHRTLTKPLRIPDLMKTISELLPRQ